MAGQATFRCRSCRTTWRWVTLPSRVSSWCGWQSSGRGFRYFQLASHSPRLWTSLDSAELVSVPAAVWMGSSTACAGGVRRSFCTCCWRSSFNHLEVCWIPFTARWNVLLLFLLILALLFGLQLLKAEANAQEWRLLMWCMRIWCQHGASVNAVDVVHAYLRTPSWYRHGVRGDSCIVNYTLTS